MFLIFFAVSICLISLNVSLHQTKEINLYLISVHSKLFVNSIQDTFNDDDNYVVVDLAPKERNSISSRKRRKEKKKNVQIKSPTINATNTTDDSNFNKTCLMDQIFDEEEGCSVRNAGKVCLFPQTVIKQVVYKSNLSERQRKKRRYYENEVEILTRFNDTQYFPKLIDRNDACRTLVLENVQAPSVAYEQNKYTESFDYYRKFYTDVFDLFNENYIYPLDLNVCCNTIIRGKKIHIIDVAQYIFVEDDSEGLAERNNKMLETLLKELQEEIDYFRQL